MASEALKLATKYAGFASVKDSIQETQEKVSVLECALIDISSHMESDNEEALKAIKYLKGFLAKQLTVAQTNVAHLRLQLDEI